MNAKQVLEGLNKFHAALNGGGIRLSSLLAEAGFDSQQIAAIRDDHLESLLVAYLETVQASLRTADGGETLYTIIRLRFGLDGEPASALAEIGARLGISPERAGQLLDEALGQCSRATNQRHFQRRLVEIARGLVGEPSQAPALTVSATEPRPALPVPDAPGGILPKLDRLVSLRGTANALRTDYEAKRAALLARFAPELEALDAEYGPMMEALGAQAESLAAEVKEDVLRRG
ncbi:MAG: hypothetical protein V1772_14435, partial [Chloroflexota bacterium]